MTQEEKAKAYDEALNQAKFYHGNCPSEPERKKLEKMFPVLCESEDERIGNVIYCIVRDNKEVKRILEGNGISLDNALAYLERQKDLAAIPDELVKNYKLFCENGRREVAVLINAINGINEQKEQKPAECSDYKDKVNVPYCSSEPEWSEEDGKKIIFLERLIRYNVPEGQYGWTDGHKGGFVTKLEAISMLKSLRPVSKESLQPHWKPSEEQMESLAYAIQVLNSNPHPKSAKAYQDLQTLYKNIKYGN